MGVVAIIVEMMLVAKVLVMMEGTVAENGIDRGNSMCSGPVVGRSSVCLKT